MGSDLFSQAIAAMSPTAEIAAFLFSFVIMLYTSNSMILFYYVSIYDALLTHLI